MPKRECLGCKERFDKEKMIILPVGAFHSMDCALQYQRDKRQKAAEKAFRAETKVMRDRVKTRSEWAREAQAAFNKYIRLRDAGQPCISCGRHHQGQYHAGHYKTVGAHPELRFDENNCHLQCAPCNNHLSGNITNYRPNLIAKIGQELVDKLEGPHNPKKYTATDFKAIKAKYKEKSKQLETMT